MCVCVCPEGLHSTTCGGEVREDRGRQPAAAEKRSARRCREGKDVYNSPHFIVILCITSLHCSVSPHNTGCVCVCVCVCVAQSGLTPLHVAAHYDNQKVALLLLNQGASPHAAAKVRIGRMFPTA